MPFCDDSVITPIIPGKNTDKLNEDYLSKTSKRDKRIDRSVVLKAAVNNILVTVGSVLFPQQLNESVGTLKRCERLLLLSDLGGVECDSADVQTAGTN